MNFYSGKSSEIDKISGIATILTDHFFEPISDGDEKILIGLMAAIYIG